MNPLSKRGLLRFGFTSGLLLSFPSLRSALAQDIPEMTAEQWMDAWMSAAKPISGALYVARFKDPIYMLLKPISWKSASVDGLPEVNVPKGFTSDFATVPRLFWSLVRPDGEYSYAAVIHDYLYWSQITTREISDQIFKRVMEEFKIDQTKIWAIYWAVRVGGATFWEENRKLRLECKHKRILAKFPEDPKITWDEWQKEPDVFAADQYPNMKC